MLELDRVFGGLEDPRAGNVRHRLGDLVVMMIAASLCGARTATGRFYLASRQFDPETALHAIRAH